MTEKKELTRLEESKAKIKSDMIKILYQRGYLADKTPTAKEVEEIDKAIETRFSFNILDYYVEAFFRLEGWVSQETNHFNWRAITKEK